MPKPLSIFRGQRVVNGQLNVFLSFSWNFGFSTILSQECDSDSSCSPTFKTSQHVYWNYQKALGNGGHPIRCILHDAPKWGSRKLQLWWTNEKALSKNGLVSPEFAHACMWNNENNDESIEWWWRVDSSRYWTSCLILRRFLGNRWSLFRFISKWECTPFGNN